MRIVVIGAGRLATCVVPALQKGGAEVCQVWSRTETSAVALANVVGCDAIWGDIAGVVHDADMYLVCIKDDAIAETVRQLHDMVSTEALIAHTSGSVALDALTHSGHPNCGVFYPMQTFTKGRNIDFAEVHVFLEASNDGALSMLHDLAARLTDESHIHNLSSKDRSQLHLAAVFVSNFVNHCCTLSENILQPTGLDFSVMKPLLNETVAKLDEMRPIDAQTGPAVRMDEGVMKKHREMLASLPLASDIYDLLSNSIHFWANS